MISVIMATYNCEATVTRALMSYMEQDYPHRELVIADGGSTDGTLCAIEKAAVGPTMSLVSEHDLGIYDAWNKALARARGQWVFLIGADDQFADRNALTNMMEVAARSGEEVPYVYARVVRKGLSPKHSKILGSEWRDPWSWSMRHIHAALPSPIMGGLYRSSWIKSRQFDVDLKIAGDYDLLLTLLRETHARPIFVRDTYVLLMGYGGVSTSPSFAWKCLRETVLVRRRYGLSVLNLSLATRICKITISEVSRTVLGPRASLVLLRYWQGIRSFLSSHKK